MIPGKSARPRLTWAFAADMMANLSLLLLGSGVVPHGWWTVAVGALGVIGGMKLTEPRRQWSQRERMERGLDPLPPPLYAPPPLPPSEGEQ